MAYHSAFDAADVPVICGMAALPLKTKARGPMMNLPEDGPAEDQVDEAIRLFRANVLFRNYDVRGPGDRTLVYLTLFIQQCLKKMERCTTKAEATAALTPLATGSHYMPGDPTWPVGSIISSPATASEAEMTRSFLKQLREALVARLVDKVFGGADVAMTSKFWLSFAKRKFLNKEFV